MKILADKLTLPGTENFGFEEYPNKPLKGQSVIREEACNGKGGSTDHAQPACRLLTNDRMKQQVNSSSHCHSNDTTKELPGRQTEKYGFLVLGHFLGDFDFDRFHLLKVGKIDKNIKK